MTSVIFRRFSGRCLHALCGVRKGRRRHRRYRRTLLSPIERHPLDIRHSFSYIWQISPIKGPSTGDGPPIERVRFCATAVDSRSENRGGAPGGAARPKQAVRASGSFCGARHARSASEWQHSPAWRGHDFRRLSALHSPPFGEIREMLWQSSDAIAPRERNCFIRPRDSV